jgi:hypothetical protein
LGNANIISWIDTSEGLAFSIVEKDMVGNIAKVRERFLKFPLQSETLQDLANSELASKEKKATEGLFWLTRFVQVCRVDIS